VTDIYWRQRLDQQLVAAENARVARLRALDEALQEVRALDQDVMDAEDIAALNAAQEVVNDLRRTW
jgi:hypothetical protein